MCPLLDKPEAGIELVSEALTQLEFKERFGVVINCAAHEIFDYVRIYIVRLSLLDIYINTSSCLQSLPPLAALNNMKLID